MFEKKVFVNRRGELKKNLKSGIILLLGNDPSPIETFANSYLFRQSSVFAYYTGINKVPSVSLLIDIDNNKEILFADDYSLEDQIWTGPLSPFSETAEKTGISCVKATSELKTEVEKIIHSNRDVHYPPTCRSESIIKLSSLLDKPVSSINNEASQKLIAAVVAQREFKSIEEIKEIETALDISYEAYTTLLRLIKPGLTEKELLGVIASILAANDSAPAFPNILTRNGHILHNLSNENTIKENDLLLVDTGAVSKEGYCSDITRTLPVSGKFTEKQKAVYNIVLEAQLKAIDCIKPGILFKDIHLETCEVIAEGLKNIGIMKGCVKSAVEKGVHALFMPHGLGHMMGMDVHDMEVFGEDNVGYDSEIKRSTQFGLSALRLGRRLKENHVLTVEPGIYFIPGLIKTWKSENKFSEFINYDKLEEYMDFGGIRIEDDVLVTAVGHKVLGNPIPKTVEDIEKTMN
jgi:Xaa-Pro aminopeptidase